MASVRPTTSEEALDAFVLQHLQARGFAGAASALRNELGTQPARKAVADGARPSLVSSLVSTMRLKEQYEELRDWVAGSLEEYRPELRAVLFPFFVHCYLELIEGADLTQAAALLRAGRAEHAVFHRAELNLLSEVTAPSQLATHEFAKRVRGRRFEVTLSAQSRALLLRHLQHASCTPLVHLLNSHISLRVERLAPPAPSDVGAAPASLTQGRSDAESGAGCSGDVAAASAQQAAASAAAQMWLGLGAEGVREVNREAF